MEAWSRQSTGFLLFILCMLKPSHSVFNVTVVGISSQQENFTLPAVEAAIDLVNQQYNATLHIDLRVIIPPVVRRCDEFANDIVDQVARFWFNRTVESGHEKSPIFFIGPSKSNQVHCMSITKQTKR